MLNHQTHFRSGRELECDDIYLIIDAEWEYDHDRQVSRLQVVESEPALCWYSGDLARHARLHGACETREDFLCPF